MTSGLLALTTMTASGCAPCDALAAGTPAPAVPASPDVAIPTQDGGSAATSAFWEGVIGVEGELTGDGRLIETNALTWQLPMTLRYVSADVGEHGGAQVVGRILSCERRPGGQIYARGDFDLGSPIGIEAKRQVDEKLTNGISMDLDDVSFEVRVAADLMAEAMAQASSAQDGQPAAPPELNADGTVTLMKMNSSDEIRATMSARIRAATIVAIPAFATAQIFSSSTGPVAMAATSPAAGTLALATAPTDEAPTGLDENGDCITDENDPDYVPDCTPADQKVAGPKKPASPGGDGTAMNLEVVTAAAAVLLAPPAAWFKQPTFRQATALQVNRDGRIFGHLAAWGVCHIGMSHQGCITAPKSRSGYAYFHTGSIETAEGTLLPIGHITLDTTHAATTGLSAAGAQNHYEVTGHAVADVAVGEDAFGIWVAGALRPGVSEAKVRELRASPLSGDWRRVAGNLELVAALAVNVPGFPIPRPKGLVAGGAVQSLVASGMLAPTKVIAPGQEGALSTEDLRYLKRLAARERELEQDALQAAASGTLDAAAALQRRVKASQLAMRAHR